MTCNIVSRILDRNGETLAANYFIGDKILWSESTRHGQTTIQKHAADGRVLKTITLPATRNATRKEVNPMTTRGFKISHTRQPDGSGVPLPPRLCANRSEEPPTDVREYLYQRHGETAGKLRLRAMSGEELLRLEERLRDAKADPNPGRRPDGTGVPPVPKFSEML